MPYRSFRESAADREGGRREICIVGLLGASRETPRGDHRKFLRPIGIPAESGSDFDVWRGEGGVGRLALDRFDLTQMWGVANSWGRDGDSDGAIGALLRNVYVVYRKFARRVLWRPYG